MSGDKKYELFYNPAGFIELHYLGALTPEAISESCKKLFKKADKLITDKKPALILVDVTKINITKNNHARMAPARKEAVKLLAKSNYDRIAVYGSLPVQVAMNTIILIAGKRDKVRAFSERMDALKWLKS